MDYTKWLKNPNGGKRADLSGANLTSVTSDYDENFIYTVGETVQVSNFDTNRWNECSSGIHFFLSRDLAVLY